jgi:hypothetical protein
MNRCAILLEAALIYATLSSADLNSVVTLRNSTSSSHHVSSLLDFIRQKHDLATDQKSGSDDDTKRHISEAVDFQKISKMRVKPNAVPSGTNIDFTLVAQVI